MINRRSGSQRTARIIFIISLIWIVAARSVIELQFYYDIDSKMGTTIYGICYITGFIALFLFFISFIILVLLFFKRRIKRNTDTRSD